MAAVAMRCWSSGSHEGAAGQNPGSQPENSGERTLTNLRRRLPWEDSHLPDLLLYQSPPCGSPTLCWCPCFHSRTSVQPICSSSISESISSPLCSTSSLALGSDSRPQSECYQEDRGTMACVLESHQRREDNAGLFSAGCYPGSWPYH